MRSPGTLFSQSSLASATMSSNLGNTTLSATSIALLTSETRKSQMIRRLRVLSGRAFVMSPSLVKTRGSPSVFRASASEAKMSR